MSGASISIGEVAEVFNGKTPSKRDKRASGHPVLKIKDVGLDHCFSGVFDNFVDGRFALKYTSRWVRENDILILNSAHNASHVASKLYLAEKEVENSLAVGEWMILRPNQDRVEPGIIYWWLNSVAGRSALGRVVTGLHLYPKDVAGLSIPFSSLDEQRRIIGILNRAAKIERLRARARERLRQFVPALFVRMFGDPVTNPFRWDAACLEEVCTVVGGGTPRRSNSAYFGGPIPWATPTDVTSLAGMSIARTKESITETGLRESSARLVPAGTVLLTSRATIGFTAIAAAPMATNQGFVNLTCDERLIPEYLAVWLRLRRDYLVQLAGGTTFKEISRSAVKKVAIPLPPLEQQRRFARLAAKADGAAGRADSGTAMAASLQSSLASRLLGGEV